MDAELCFLLPTQFLYFDRYAKFSFLPPFLFIFSPCPPSFLPSFLPLNSLHIKKYLLLLRIGPLSTLNERWRQNVQGRSGLGCWSLDRIWIFPPTSSQLLIPDRASASSRISLHVSLFPIRTIFTPACRYKYLFILRSWLTWLWGLANPNFSR